MVVTIKGIDYKVKLLTKEKYLKKEGSSSYAKFNSANKQLLFRDDHIKKGTVIHEVTHAFFDALHLASCHNISLEDFEEIVCEMLEVHLMDINRISNQILRHLKMQSEDK